MADQSKETSGTLERTLGLNAVAQLTDEDDVVILPEAGTTDRDKFFNTLHEDIQEAIECPVLVVLREGEGE